MDRAMRTLLLLLVAGMGFLAGSIVHLGAVAAGPGKAPPCANATPTPRPAPGKVGVGSYNGWTVTVTRFARHKPTAMEATAMPPGYALYVLHVIVENRGTQTWDIFGNQFRLEDERHQVYAQEPLDYYPDVHPLCCDTLTPGTRMEGDLLKEAPAAGHFPRLRVLLAGVAGSPDLVVTLPPLQPA